MHDRTRTVFAQEAAHGLISLGIKQAQLELQLLVDQRLLLMPATPLIGEGLVRRKDFFPSASSLGSVRQNLTGSLTGSWAWCLDAAQAQTVAGQILGHPADVLTPVDTDALVELGSAMLGAASEVWSRHLQLDLASGPPWWQNGGEPLDGPIAVSWAFWAHCALRVADELIPTLFVLGLDQVSTPIFERHWAHMASGYSDTLVGLMEA